MAVWADIVAKVDELKKAWKKVSDDLVALHAKFDECMKQDHLDQEALEAVKNELAGVVGDMESAHHADGM
jgi:cell division FtsZ-interacting protein ZapD